MDELEDEYRRSAAAAMPSGRRRGYAHIAIDFENQIFAFPDHSVPLSDGVSYIYSSNAYDIVAFYGPIGKINNQTGEVDKVGARFSTDDIYVVRGKDEELLDDYAYDFILGSTAVDNIFESKDFLVQTCITHTIQRIWNAAQSIDPWNEVRKRRHKKVEDLENAILRLIDPKIKRTAGQLFNRWGGVIDKHEIEARALIYAAALLFGDNKKIIGRIVNSSASGGTRSTLRNMDRDLKIHPYSTHSSKKQTNVDIERMQKEGAQQISDLMLAAMQAGSWGLVETLLILRNDPDAFASFISEGISLNSKWRFCPNPHHNALDFIFGNQKRNRPPLIQRFLRDSFRTEKDRAKKQSQFNDGLENEQVPTPPRRWKKNDVSSKYSIEELSQFKTMSETILSGKLLATYKDFLSGSHDSKNEAKRQCLHRAKKIIREKAPDLPH